MKINSHAKFIHGYIYNVCIAQVVPRYGVVDIELF